MKINFKHICIDNFKNIEHLETELCNKTFIYGANETGKTSFADAIFWCLTGKNSLGDSQFHFIPIWKSNVSPSVTIDIEIDDGKTVKPVTLSRIYEAKFNKSKEFTGLYQTVYFINKLKVGPREFDKWVEEHICSSEIFRLIYDVRYFTENISTSGRERPWEAQRRLLFGISNVPEDIVFASMAKNKKRFELLLNGLSRYDNASQYLSFLKSEEKRIENELQQYNVKLETMRAMYSEVNEPNADSKIELIRNEINEKLKGYREEQSEYLKKWDTLVKQKNNLYSQYLDIDARSKKAISDVSSAKEACEGISIYCPACGQYMPSERIETQRNELQNRITELENERISLEEKRDEIKGKLIKVQKKLSELKQPEAHENGIKELQDQITILSQETAKLAVNRKIKKDSNEIKEKTKKLLDERAENTRLLDLCKDFIDVKCKYTEKKVNDLFDGIEFKMFRKNKTNDEIRECCDIFWNGIPYESLSYSTKFIVSMKIALGFQNFYGIEFPIIIDNAESIDVGQDIPVQTIFLIKREENCKCGSETGRKEKDGMWTCKKCENRFMKTLEIVTK